MNKLMQSISDYEIITERKVYDEHYMNEEENEAELRTEEQNQILESLGIDYYSTICGIHFIKGYWSNGECRKDTIDEAIQCLAIKDGVDLVKFQNGNIGFVSYYNGHKDAFEIMHVFNK